mmetsp:Transcript_32418/g.78473  ORF Transcript_32418/g.78473 Transcript_32418/m.78473 type:complete len:205 (-) Transcript_32418:1418-2032(-)
MASFAATLSSHPALRSDGFQGPLAAKGIGPPATQGILSCSSAPDGAETHYFVLEIDELESLVNDRRSYFDTFYWTPWFGTIDFYIRARPDYPISHTVRRNRNDPSQSAHLPFSDGTARPLYDRHVPGKTPGKSKVPPPPPPPPPSPAVGLSAAVVHPNTTTTAASATATTPSDPATATTPPDPATATTRSATATAATASAHQSS